MASWPAVVPVAVFALASHGRRGVSLRWVRRAILRLGIQTFGLCGREGDQSEAGELLNNINS